MAEQLLKLRVTLKGRPVRAYSFKKECITVGRDPESDVFLDKPTGTLYVSLFATIGSGRYGGVYKVRTAGGEAPLLVGKTFGFASFGQSALTVSGSTVYFGAGALWQVPK